MENASKALLMAGSILIAMLVISIGVYIFLTASDLGSAYEQRMEIAEIEKFNSNFIIFEDREDIKIQEIVSLAKFAKQYKEKTGIETLVKFKGSNLLTINNEDDFIGIVKNNSMDGVEIKNFKFQSISYDPNTGMVNEINFGN